MDGLSEKHDMNVVTPKSACQTAAEFLRLIKDLSDDGLLLTNESAQIRAYFAREIDAIIKLCIGRDPSLATVKKVEDFLITVLVIFDMEILLPQAPEDCRQLFIDALDIAGSTCACACNDIRKTTPSNLGNREIGAAPPISSSIRSPM